MNNGLKKVNDLLNYMEEYTKRTGREPVVTIGKSFLEEIQSDLQRFGAGAESSKVIEAFNRIKTAPTFMGGTPEYRASTKSEIPFLQDCELVEKALLKAQGQQNENELLKEIIKSLFDKGCPLHQYNDNKFGLTIEVDKEFSIMHLGEFKGADLDKFLNNIIKEVQ